jgi:hypothetical protein
LRNLLKEGDLVIISLGNLKFRAIGEVTGPYQYVTRKEDEYFHRRAVRWLWHDNAGLPREQIYSRGFIQRSIYQLDNANIEWEALEQIVAGGGQIGEGGGPPEPYVLIIDEINRADISKVFGELITLLEGPVLFHLHDSYPRKTIHIRRIREHRYAILEEVTAYGTFTVGAQVKAADGRWTRLEFDLATLKDLPQRFIGR